MRSRVERGAIVSVVLPKWENLIIAICHLKGVIVWCAGLNGAALRYIVRGRGCRYKSKLLDSLAVMASKI